MLDHRDSPGVNPELERLVGLPAGATKAGAFFESATVSCRHCQRQIILNPDRSRERHRCRGCDRYICDMCAGVYAIDHVCRDIERQFAEVLERAAHQAMRTVHTGFAPPAPPADNPTPTVYSAIALDAQSGDTTASQAILLP